MNPPAWMQTVDGQAVALHEPPAAGAITRRAWVQGVCTTPRFAGQVPAPCQIMVGHHLIWGCDAILYETGDMVAAAYFLLHDAHEGLIGDMTRPVQDALTHRMGAISPLAATAFRSALSHLKGDLDYAIHTAEGLPWPVPPAARGIVKAYDLRMLETERRRHLNQGLANPPRWQWDNDPPREVRCDLTWVEPHRLADALTHRLDSIVPAARKLLAQPRPAAENPAARFLRLARAT